MFKLFIKGGEDGKYDEDISLPMQTPLVELLLDCEIGESRKSDSSAWMETTWWSCQSVLA